MSLLSGCVSDNTIMFSFLFTMSEVRIKLWTLKRIFFFKKINLFHGEYRRDIFEQSLNQKRSKLQEMKARKWVIIMTSFNVRHKKTDECYDGGVYNNILSTATATIWFFRIIGFNNFSQITHCSLVSLLYRPLTGSTSTDLSMIKVFVTS